MLNNMYGQQNYGQRAIIPNVINIVQPIAYQQQPIYYDQNKVYIGGVYNQQQPKPVGQSYNYHQVISIPGYTNNYQQIQNQQLQNIYPNNNQLNLYQQVQTKNIQQQLDISMNKKVVFENKQFQQKSKIQNNQIYSTFINLNIKQNQVNSISRDNKNPTIKKEGGLDTHADPMTKEEIDELYEYEPAICKMRFKVFKNGEIRDGIGTGFFLEINDDNIPFKKALFTNNHVLNKNSIEIGKEIEFEYCKKLKNIKMTENRKAFTNEELEYTCIEIFDRDKINKFFRIDETVFNNKSKLKNKEIFILQYPSGILSFDSGKILDIENNIIKHSVFTKEGSSGSALIKRYNNNLIIGIHYGSQKDKNPNKYLYNVATPFGIIIKDIKYQLNNNKNIINYRNIINLIYEKKEKDYYLKYLKIKIKFLVQNLLKIIKVILN